MTTNGFSEEKPLENVILKSKIAKKNHRYSTYLLALKLLRERGLEVIVETGTARDGKKNCGGDGCSTLIFSKWVQKAGGSFYSVDIDQEAIENVNVALGELPPNVQLIHSDSISFLTNFGRQIDFLYLDSYDFDCNDPNPSQEHHLKEIESAYPWLSENSVVMIDDCALPHGGKGKLVIEFLVQRGWMILADAYQVILVKNA